MVVPMRTYQGQAIVANGASVDAERREGGDDLLREDDERHRRDRRPTCRGSRRADSPAPEDAEEEAAEQSAVGERGDASATTTTGVFVSCGKSSAPQRQDDAPDSAKSLPMLQRLRDRPATRFVSGR